MAFAFGLFVLLSLYDVIAHNRRSVLRMGVNLILSCAATAGVVTTRLVAPVIWEWILSLDTPTVVLLATLICGMTILFIPLKMWKTLRQRNTFGRASLSETSEDPDPAPKEPKAVLNKKAIKDAALRPGTQEFDV